MTKTEFSQLLAYLKNRPSEAARLLDVLEANVERSSRETVATKIPNSLSKSHNYHSGDDSMKDWLTVREVCTEIGMKRTWLKDHLQFLPQEWKRRVGAKGKWMIHPDSLVELHRMAYHQELTDVWQHLTNS